MTETAAITDRKNNLTARNILEAATKFFALKGYHGTSIRDIAKEADISIATLYYYAKNKDDLYCQVFEEVYREEIATIGGVLDKADPNSIRDPKKLRELLFQLMDALIDRSSSNPYLIHLWAQRWLDKPENSEYIDAEYSAPLYEMVREILIEAERNEIIKPELNNLNLVLHSFTWLHYSFFSHGRLTYGIQVKDPYEPEQIEEFREYIHTIISRILRFSDQQQ
ncbi:MAG: TetR/AcrR family transcriptional regulator [Bacillota bacterium]